LLPEKYSTSSESDLLTADEVWWNSFSLGFGKITPPKNSPFVEIAPILKKDFTGSAARARDRQLRPKTFNPPDF